MSKDCAVCKDQFQLGTEDPDEQIVVQLPCKHSFHQPCILPWLKSSGTCPVCRYALVPQPDHNVPRNNPTSPSTSTPLGASGDRLNPSSSPSTAPRARSQSPRFGHRSPRPSGRPTPESYRNSSASRGFAPFLFRNLAVPRGYGSLASPPDTTSSEPPPIPLPTSSSFEPTSESPRTLRPSWTYTHRSNMDSSVPFIPRSQSHSGNQLRDQNSGGGSGSGSGGGSGTQGRRPHGQQPHVPGDWSDDLMDLD